MRARGHDVTLVDAFALPGSGLTWRDDGRAHLGASVDDVLAAATGDGAAYDHAVVTCTPFHRPPHRDDVLAAVLAGLAARAPATPRLLADAYQSGQHYVETGDDAVLAAYPEAAAYVKYEAEVTVPALLEATTPATGTHRGASPALADLPAPAWDLVDLAARDAFAARVVAGLGRGRWTFPIDGRTLPVVTSRGCPFGCAHCSSNPERRPGEPKTQRRRPADRLAADLDALVRVHGATRLAVLDELLNVNEAHFDRFLALAGGLDVAFEIPNGLRADYLEPRHFARMRGRVTTVSVSAESGSQRVLDHSVGKQLDLARIHQVAADAHRAGVPLLIHYMIGLPGETAEEINQTLELALTLWDDHGAQPAVQFATPLPGTRLAEGRRLPVVTDWGPHFQKGGGAPLSTVDAATLQRFMTTFRQRLAASSGPQKLIMNVTYVCNNHCTFCAVGTRTQIDGHPTRQREHLARYRRAGVRMVDFDGGEPTLNPELIPLIRYARALGYDRINVTTNGRLCAYPDFAARLVGSGLTTLLFSVHGATARSHGREVGVAEAFEQTTAGIRHAVAAAAAHPGVELGMNITLTRHNYAELDDVGELALALGLPWLNVQFLTPFGRATTRHAPDTATAAAVAMRFIDRFADRMKIQLVNLPFCFVPGYERYAAGDLNKLRRHMVFVNNDTVNLADYLAERRRHRAECGPCPHRCFCGGFYELEDAPEPPWLVSAEALVRRVDPV
ncbi:MAG: radical SAM protein [Kofleriaceae bacterium]|nr:radical SAM protein [Kofleriaceae bacterium]